MILNVTPFTLGDAVLGADPMATLARGGRHVVQRARDYDERDPFTVDAEDEHAACEEAWRRYQNLDDQRTPDGGRSLMTGDMLRIMDLGARVTWWICCSIGWEETVPPGDERVEITADTARKDALA